MAVKVTYLVAKNHFAPLSYAPITAAEMATLSSLPGAVILDDLVLVARRYAARLANLGTYDKRTVQIAYELAQKLEQLNFLVKSIRLITHEYFKRSLGKEPMSSYDQEHLYFLMYFYATTFYYLAHRAESLLESGSRELPEVDNYTRVRGIEVTRNTLLEHAYEHQPELGGREHLVHGHFGPAIGLWGENGKSEKIRKQLNNEAVLVHAKDFRERALVTLGRAFDRLPAAQAERD